MKFVDWIKRFWQKSVELRQAKTNVAKLFSSLYPEEKIVKVLLEVEEPDRYVIWVWYDQSRPPTSKFFYVNKSDFIAHVLDDDSKYRPKFLR
jgi:hypothetical protein